MEEKAVVIPQGKIDFSNSQDLKEELLDVYDEGFNEIIIDFSNISSIDSSGLGKILLFHKKLKEREGELKIRNISSDYVKKMFNMIHLDKIINIEGMEQRIYIGGVIILSIDIPGQGKFKIENLILDYNGTIARDGKIIEKVKDRINKLSKKLNIYIVTADTFGTVRKEFKDENVNIKITDDKISGTKYKNIVLKELGEEKTTVIANGFNDSLILKNSLLSILVIGTEGVAKESLLNSDIIVNDVIDAFDLLIHTNRLKATLRK